MERQLQERLIGATVLMIVAVLVVPELLSGPKPEPSAPAAGNDSMIRGESPPVAAVEMPVVAAVRDPAPASLAPSITTARPPSTTPPVVLPEPAPAITPPRTSPTPARPSPVAARPEAREPASQPATTAASAPLAKPPATKPGTVGKGGWSVQVGSYAKAATAKRIATDLQNHGFAAVVLPVDLQGKRLYRVRVGPATDRKTADQTLRKVQRLMPSSRLVGNP